MDTMKAIVCTNYGPPEVLQMRDVEKPGPAEYEVLIKIRAGTAHIGDTKIRSMEPGLGKVKDFFFKPVLLLGKIDNAFQENKNSGTIYNHGSCRFGPFPGRFDCQ